MPVGTLVVEAAQAADWISRCPAADRGAADRAPCRWAADSPVRRRSSLRLSPDDVARGYALACQTVLEGDASITCCPGAGGAPAHHRPHGARQPGAAGLRPVPRPRACARST
ncbi:MAG: hypothetical protein R2851_12325 [Caldilineaceae bacterium]